MTNHSVFEDLPWHLTKDKKPLLYDLVYIKEEESSHKIPGWWDGHGWCGLRVKKNVCYKLWKKYPHMY